MTFAQLSRRVARNAVDHALALHGRALQQHIGPARYMVIVLYGQKLRSCIQPALHQSAVPQEDRNIRDRITIPRGILAFRQTSVEQVELSLRVDILGYLKLISF
jgi:hypothetical protein